MQKELDEREVPDDVTGESAQTPSQDAAAEQDGDPDAGDAAAAPEATAAGADDAIQRELDEAQAKIAEQWDQLVRARAEIENRNKRHQRELESAHKFALEKFVAELLGVWDSLELGLSHVHENAGDVDKLREGTELTLKLLTDALRKFGVEQVDPDGQPFDPELHQAMSMQPRDDLPPNTVVNVIQKGCTLNGRLVRPALVIVSQAGAGGAAPGDNLDTQA